MNKDLRNVAITFGLIALVFTGSSFVYNKKQEQEYFFAVYQADLDRVEKEKLALIDRNTFLEESLKKYKDALVLAKNVLEKQLANRNIQNSNVAKIQPTPIKVQTPVVVQKPLPVATPITKQVVLKPSRKSRAS